MNKTIRKLLKQATISFLAVILVVTFILNGSSDRILKATELDEEGDYTTEEITEEEYQLDESTIQIDLPLEEDGAKEEVQPGETPTEELPSDEGETPPEENIPSENEETSSEQPGEEEIVLPNEEPVQQEVVAARPAQQLSAAAEDGTRVIIRIREDVLEEGAYVEIHRIYSSQIYAQISETLEEDEKLVDLVAYDITLYDRYGNEVQPDASVQVTLLGADVENGEETAVYHIDESGETEKIAEVTDSENVSFSTSGFSTFVIASSSSTAETNATTSTTYTLTVGETQQLKTGTSYRYTSSNNKVASVNSSGLVTAVSAGTATITVKSGMFGSTVATYTIKVEAASQEPSVSVTPASVSLTTLGQTNTLTATLKNIDSENTIVWVSSDPSVVSVVNGTVTALKAGSAVITASVSPEEDELYGNTYSASATVTVTLSEYNLYHYALIPGADMNDGGSGDDSWFGLGVTKIVGVPNPTTLKTGAVDYAYEIGATVKALYPDLTYNGNTFKYAASGSAEAEEYGYYTVQPFRVVVAPGANAGNNGYNTTTTANSYHLDYICVLNEINYVSVNFAVKYPGTSSFAGLTDYATRVASGTAESSVSQPSSSVVPAIYNYKGISYAFDGWYTDSSLSTKASFSGTVDKNTTYYASYKATNAYYNVEYYYDGVIDDSLSDRLGPVDLGTVITSYTAKLKTGFTLSEVVPGSITVQENEENNVIRVYYTKRLVNYRVGYYLNGTDEAIAPSKIKSVRYGEVGSGELLEIEGYTPVSNQSIISRVIESANMEIRFEYYQNVTLTSASQVCSYDGEEHSLSGYTSSVAGAEFVSISAQASATAAGSYPLVFSAGALGSVDTSERYIVTALSEGILEIEKAPVIIRANNSGKAYGERDPQLSAEVINAFNDGYSFVYRLNREAGEDIGSYAIQVSGEEEQGNYSIRFENGTFEITAADTLSIYAVGYEGIYDGEEHTLSVSASAANTTFSYSVNNGITFTDTLPTIKDVGEIQVIVRAQNPNYITVLENVSLKVTPKSVTIRAIDKDKTYGEADPAFEATVEGLLNNDSVSYSLRRDSGEDAGCYVIHPQAAETQGNYKVSTVDGTFEIHQGVLSLQAVTSQKLYDGTALSSGIDGSLPEGSTVSYSVDGGESWSSTVPALKHVGTLSYSVRVENRNFATAYLNGSLSVLPRTVNITSLSASKSYDGKALTNHEVYYSGDGFVSGEGVTISYSGTQTLVGSSANSFTYLLQDNTAENDYTVNCIFGTLSVTNRDAKFGITVKASDHSAKYDGQNHAVSGLVTNQFIINDVTYTVMGLSAETTQRNAGKYEIPVTGTAAVLDENGNDVTDQFAISTESGTLTIEKRQVTLSSISLSKVYDGRALNSYAIDNYGISTLLDGFVSGEGVIVQLTGRQTLPGTSDNSFSYVLAEGTLADNYDISVKFGTLTVTNRNVENLYEITLSFTQANAVYNGEQQSVSGLDADSFVINGVIYHVEGIYGYAEGVHAGNYPIEYIGEAVVLDEDGNDVTAQFTIFTENNSWQISPRPIEFRSASAEKEYDGEILTARSVDVLLEGFAGSDSADFTISGSQLLPGSSDNSFTYSFSSDTLASDYQVKVTYGTLKVTDRTVKYEISITAVSDRLLYDGQEHSYSGLSETTFTYGKQTYTLSGVRATVTAKNAGSYAVIIEGTPVICDAEGNDVTRQFDVQLHNGTLMVDKRKVTLISGSAEKQYDGNALTEESYTVSNDGFAEGEGVTLTYTGTQTLVGSSENKFTYEWKEGTLSDNYEITVSYGTLNVLNRNAKYVIDVYGNDGEYRYNGQTQSVNGLKQTIFEIEGNSYTVAGLSAYGEGRNAGEYTISIQGTAKVYDAEGNDVTGEFAIRMHEGTLNILRRSLIFTSASAYKVYDGDPLTTANLPDQGITISGDGFVMNEGVRFQVTGSRTLTGLSRNTFSYEAEGATDLNNYAIETEFGELRVISRNADQKYPIRVAVKSVSALYDGKEHEVSEIEGCTVLVNNHTYTVEGLSVHVSAIDAGEYEAVILGEARVLDHEGNDVSEEFALTKENGTLIIHRRNVELTSASAEKEYDGSPLTVTTVTVSYDGFAEGEGAVYDISGSQTLVGSSFNSFTYRLNLNTKASNYNITKNEGILSVVNRTARYEIVLEANSMNTKYDGTEKTVSGFKTLSFTFDGVNYTVEGVSASVSATHAGEYPLIINNNGKVYDENHHDVTDQFALSVIGGNLCIEKRQITFVSSSAEKEYDGTVLKNEEVQITGDGFASGEGAQFDVYGEQLVAGSSENNFSYTLNENTLSSDYEILEERGRLSVTRREKQYEITVRANSGEAVYDGKTHTVSGFETLRFTQNGQTFTVSGLSASASGQNAGSYTAEVTGEAIVKDSRGNDVTSEFIVHTENGTLNIEKRTVTLTSASAHKEYDGTALTSDSVQIGGSKFASGEGVLITVTGTQTLPGSSPNSFSYTFNDNTSAENYEIRVLEGTLSVTDRESRYEISLQASGKETLYSGQMQEVSGFESLSFIENGVSYRVEGVSASASGKNAGSYPTVFSGTPLVRDASGNDVTSQFTIHLIPSVLRIDPRSVSIISSDSIKEYDGRELKNEEVRYEGDGFVLNEGAEISFSGSRTLVGSSENSFSYVLKDNTDENNYVITLCFGSLTVTNRSALYQITAEAQSGEFTYDGNVHTVSGLQNTTFFVDGSRYTLSGLSAESSAVNAGTTTVTVTGEPKVTDASGNDVSAQFAVHTENGTLKVNRRNVKLISSSDQKEYDGLPLTNGTVSIEGEGFVRGEGVSISVSGTRTLVGETENSFVYSFSDGTDASNYTIETEFGTLRVLDRNDKYEITVTANSLNTEYDGSVHSVSGFETLQFRINGNIYTVSGLSASLSEKDAGSYTVNVEGSAVVKDAKNNDVTSQFVVKTENGNLVIQKRQLTLTSESAEKEYDGTALSADRITVSGSGFAPEEGASYIVSGSQTLVGESVNSFTYTLNEGVKASNYQITKEEGKLTVTNRVNPYLLTVTALSREVLYNGSMQSLSGFETLSFTENGLPYTVSGLKAEASGINAGSYSLQVKGTAVVYDSDKNDVSAQFDVRTVDGQLTIQKRSVRFTSLSAEKEYDGSPLTKEEVIVEGDGLAPNEDVEFIFDGSQRNVGVSDNTFRVAFKEAVNPENYQIETAYGTLTVTDRSEPYAITLTPNEGEYLYDGSEKSISGFESVRFNIDGHIYKVEGVEAFANGQNAGHYPVEIRGNARVLDADENDVTSQFSVSIADKELVIEQRKLTLNSGSDEKEYDALPLKKESVAVSGDGFAPEEGAVYFFSGEQLLVGESNNTFSYTLKENTKAENYIITVEEGLLNVTDREEPLEIELVTNSREEKYDGREHSLSGFETLEFKVNGADFSVEGMTAYASGVNSGSYCMKSEGSARVLDASGNDVTKQFIVHVTEKELKILPRTLTITSSTANKEYDGTALKAESITIGADGFAVGEGAIYSYSGQQVLPGSSDNIFTYELQEGTLAENYSIRLIYGKLSVIDRNVPYEITVEALSGKEKYDGSEHVLNGFKTLEFEVDGNKYTVSGLTAEGRGTDSGSYPVEIHGDAVIRDKSGNDVTSQFALHKVSGILQIEKRSVILSSASADKVYDGKALTAADVSVSGDGFAANEGASYEVNGSRTLVGSSENSFSYTLKENTKAENYVISKEYGNLRVDPREAKYEIRVEALSSSYVYDGNEKALSGFKTLEFEVEGNTYTVSGLKAYGSGTDAGRYTVSISGDAIVKDAAGNDVSDQFIVKKISGEIVIEPRKVTLRSIDATKEYDGTVLRANEVRVEGAGFASSEGAEITYSGEQLITGSSANRFSYTFNENTKAENYEITVVYGTLEVTGRNARYEIEVKANSGTVRYDGGEHSVSGFETLSFSINGVNFTVEGITASVRGTDAGRYSNAIQGTAVVRDSRGNDVTSQFIVNLKSGEMIIERREVTLTSGSAEKEYDGSELTAHRVSVSGDGFVKGEEPIYRYEGSQKLRGVSDNIFYYSFKEGIKAENYVIIVNYGSLNVTARESAYEIEVEAKSDAVKYDGKTHKVSGIVSDSFEVEGNTYRVEGLRAEAEGTDAGSYAVNVEGTAVVYDSEGNDVSEEFKVRVKSGELIIERREVTLTSGSAEKEYDGKALRAEEVSVSGDGFAANEGASYEVYGSRTVTGSSENSFDYVLSENTKAKNYNITKVFGTLEVKNRNVRYEIEVKANSDTVIYDGTEHNVSGFETLHYEIGGVDYYVEGLKAKAEGKDAGSYPVIIQGTPVVLDKDGNDVTSQFCVTLVQGELKIDQRLVVLRSGSAEREYNGNPLTSREMSVEEDGFAVNEGADYTFSGSQTVVGSSLNTFTYVLQANTDANNYAIHTEYGLLNVINRNAPYELTLIANSQEALYDGKVHTASGIAETEFEMDGNRYTVSGLSAERSAVDAGSYAVMITGVATVRDSQGNDVSEQFRLHFTEGTLLIHKRSVVLISKDATKMYDGNPLTENTILVESDGFAANEGASYEVNGSRTLVGSSENSFSYTLKENTKAENYVISKEYGNLRVDPREAKYEIRVEALSSSYVYDGNEKALSGFKTLEFEVEGNTYTVSGLKAYGSGTDAGRYTVSISGDAIVKDAAGNDVSDQFIVKKISGEIVIEPRKVTLRSIDATKEYDGTVLRANEVRVEGAGFASSEGAEITYSGEQLITGSSANRFSYTFNENTKAENYEITVVYGTLEVTGRNARYEIEVKANSGTVRYDGGEHSVSGFETLSFSINGVNFTVEGITASVRGTDAGRYSNAIQGTAVVRDSRGNDVTSQFIVNLKSGEMIIERREVTLTSGSAEKEYDGSELTAHRVSVSGDGFVKGEEPIYRYEGSQKLRGVSDNIFYYSFKEGIKAENYVIIVNYGSLNVTARESAYEIEVEAKSDAVKYDGKTHKVSGIVSDSFEVEGNTYRVEGLRAEAEGTDAGSYAVNVEGTAVVYDSEGNDVSEEFKVRVKSGELIIERREVTLTSGSAEKEYDGKALRAEEVSVSGDGFAANEGASYEVYGSRTVTGSSENSFDYVMSENTKAENYNITKVFGTLEVVDREEKYVLRVTANSGSFLYNGQSREISGLENASFVIDGVTYTLSGLSARESDTNAGSYAVEIQGTPVVHDPQNNDVTDQFYIIQTNGSLEIRPREVSLTSGSAEKEYDGRALTNSEVYVGEDGFANSEGASYEVIGQQLLVGSSANTFSYALNGDTQADNYQIYKEEGVLSVTNRSVRYDITLTANSLKVLYDGEEHTVSGFESLSFERNGRTYTVEGITASVSATHAGEYPLVIEHQAKVLDENGDDVTGQFAVHVINGSLIIEKREVVLTSGSSEKEYDGKPLTNSTVTVSKDGFVSEEGAAYEVRGSQTLVGFAQNTFDYTLNENTSADDYIIRKVYGQLQVKNRNARYEIEVQAKSAEYLYDGEEKSVTSLVTSKFGINDEIYTVEGLSVDTRAVHAGEYETVVIGEPVIRDSNGNDVTDQFVVSARNGKMVIRARQITLQSGSATKIYDGKPLYSHEVIQGGDGFVRNDGISIQMSGIRTTPGIQENTFSYSYNEGTRESDYIITSSYGVLTVLNRPDNARYEVNLVAASLKTVYDGTEHTVHGLSTINGIEAEETENGYVFEIDGNIYNISGIRASVTGTHAQSYANTVTGDPYITDAEGNDVTGEFLVTTQSGQLDITKREVVLTSGSATHAYTGKALTNPEVTISGDGFAVNEGATYDVSGYRTLVGISENTFSYTLQENTVESDYLITTVYGLLTVTNRDARYEITLTPESGRYLYDGAEKTIEGFRSLTFEINGVTYTVSGISAGVSATDAGIYPVRISGSAVVTDPEGNDVTDQFSILSEAAELEIEKRRVVLTSLDISKEYDGTPLMGEEVLISEDGFAEGEGATFLFESSRTLVGISENSFTYVLSDNTKAENYEIITVFGLLSVTDRDARYEIELQANSAAYRYDGQLHTAEGFETTEFEVDGHIYVVEGLSAYAEAVEPGLYTTAVSGEAVVLDEDGNDVTDQFAIRVNHGTLEIRSIYRLIVRYVDENGNALSDPYIGYYEAGESYGPIRVPQIAGYIAPYRYVVSSERGMPSEDLTVTVVYSEANSSTPEENKEGRGVVDIDEESKEIVVEVVEEDKIPLANVTKAYWALINLLEAIVSAVLSLLLLIHYLFEKKEKQTEEEEKKEDEEEKDQKKKRLRKAFSVGWFAVSVIAFVLTENMSNTMCLFDRWTIWMLVFFLIHLCITYSALREKDDSEEEEDLQDASERRRINV